MKTISRNKSLAAAVLAAVTFGTPALAQANNYQPRNLAYEDCQQDDHDNRVIGGIIGAVAGGVAGSQVAGRGARTEGSVLGAAIGAVAGSEIGADRRDCRDESGRAYRTSHSYSGSTYGAPARTVTTYPSRTSTTYYGGNRGYTDTGSRRGYTTTSYPRTSYGYGHRDQYHRSSYKSQRRRAKQRVETINCDLDELRTKKRRLKDRLKYAQNPYRVERKLDKVVWQIQQLKDEKKRLKRRFDL